MSRLAAEFYISGGTLPRNSPSYIERQADADLIAGLTAGEFCYVLTSRQMGKSSLMVHTAARLRAAGAAVALLDLTALGHNLTVDQWYGGLLVNLGRQLDLEDEVEAYWLEHERQSPLHRWMRCLQEVVLPELGCRVKGVGRREGTKQDPTPYTLHPTPSLVIFLDEIDMVRSLPFSTDEFFAGIRECYNRRSEEPALARLVFCLLGVAAPSELIQDTRMTPFNIGRRIELTDFTEAEAAPLAAGLGVRCSVFGVGSSAPNTEHRTPNTERLLQRILYWTGGHPYLTQRLCQAVAAAVRNEERDGGAALWPRSGQRRGSGPGRDERSAPSAQPSPRIPDSAAVDRLCDTLFLTPGAQEQDNNLLFVRERLLGQGDDTAALLELYGRVWAGKPIPAEDANPLVERLRLSGVVSLNGGVLRARNRIYARVFDRRWVAIHLPDAERQRQAAAYQRGLARASLGGAAVVAVVAGLARRAMTESAKARRSLYVARMNLAHQAWEADNVSRTQELLDSLLPQAGRADRRAFEWHYVQQVLRNTGALLPRPGSGAAVAAVPADGRYLAVGSGDGTVHLLTSAGEAIGTLGNPGAPITGIACSHDGRLIAAGDAAGVIRVWNAAGGCELAAFQAHAGEVSKRLSFSPDGTCLASCGSDGTASVWSVRSWRQIGAPLLHSDAVNSAVFSPDGQWLATAAWTDGVRVWDAATLAPVAALSRPGHSVVSAVFSPDGARIATAGWDRTLRLWSTSDWREQFVLSGHRDGVTWVEFSPDGRLLASSCWDSTLRLWDLTSRTALRTLRGHPGVVAQVRFLQHGQVLASIGEDGSARLWDPGASPEWTGLPGHRQPVLSLAFAPDGAILATGSAERVLRQYHLETGQVAQVMLDSFVSSVAFSPDGRLLAAGTGSGTVYLLRAGDNRPRATLRTISCAANATMPPSDEPIPPADRWHVLHLAFSPDGRTLATAGSDGTFQLWCTRKWRCLAAHEGPASGTRCLAFSPDGAALALGKTHGTVDLWNPKTRQRIATLHGHTDDVHSVAFSPDGRLLLSGGGRNDKTVKVWSTRGWREIAVFTGHHDSVRALAFSPDGRTLATAGWDRTVRFWNTTAWQEMVSLHFNYSLRCAAFAPDGATLAVGGDPGACFEGRIQAAGVDSGLYLCRSTPAPSHQPPLQEWHALQAGECEQAGHWAAAVFHLDRLPALNPPAALRQRRARAAALAGTERIPLTMPRAAAVHPPDADSQPAPVELTRHYNVLLNEAWMPDGDRLSLAALPRGVHDIAGAPFDLRGLIQLCGGPFPATGGRFPDRSSGILLGKAFRRLYILHAAVSRVPDGAKIASLVATYADGRQVELSLRYGFDVADWRRAADPHATLHPAWTDAGPEGGRAGGTTRLFLSIWENPSLHTPVETLDYYSLCTDSAPFLVALTMK